MNNRSKAPLSFMEMVVMLLVFSIAATICIQALALSDRLSKENEQKSDAMIACQNIAECLKAENQEKIQEEIKRFETEYKEKYHSKATIEIKTLETLNNLNKVYVSAQNAKGEVLFGLKVSWQIKEGGYEK